MLLSISFLLSFALFLWLDWRMLWQIKKRKNYTADWIAFDVSERTTKTHMFYFFGRSNRQMSVLFVYYNIMCIERSERNIFVWLNCQTHIEGSAPEYVYCAECVEYLLFKRFFYVFWDKNCVFIFIKWNSHKLCFECIFCQIFYA